MIKKVNFSNFFELWIASRYIRLKNKNNFISFISLTSIIGITLGVMALIIVLSVMNGFQSELKNKILSVASDIEVTGSNYLLRDWKNNNELVQKQNNVSSVAPFTHNQSMIAQGRFNRGVIVRGIDPNLETHVSDIHKKIIRGKYTLNPGRYELLLGIDLARYFNLKVGDKVALISSQANFSALGALPRIKQFTVTGIFDAGMYEYDSSLVITHMNDAQNLFQLNDLVSGLKVKLSDLSKTQATVNNLESLYQNQPDIFIFDWTKKHANLFAAIQMEKKVMFIILTLIIAVAAFNIVSTLVMGVTEKRSDIAILRTIGATPKSIMFIFIIQGVMIGILGTLLGMILGITIALNIDTIVPFIEGLFSVQFLPKDIYYISKIPSKLLANDVISIVLMGMFLSFIATIYPSYKASKMDPAMALKYE